MTTLPTLSFHHSGPGGHEDNMEIGTSPLPHVDDVEFDLDDMQDTFDEADKSMHDDIADNNDSMQPENYRLTQDDDMIDGEHSMEFGDNSIDAKMQSHENNAIQDEDIFFDEEEEEEEIVENTENQELPVETVSKHSGSETKSTETGGTQQNVKEDENISTKDGQDLQQVPHGLTITEALAEKEAKDSDEPDVATSTDIVDFADQKEATAEDRATNSLTEGSDKTDDYEDDIEKSSNPGSITKQTSTAYAHDNLPKNDSPSIDPLALEPDAAQLHSIKVNYFDQEMSLFPPKNDEESTTFFLQDAFLAYENFDKLLAACREVLGESLGHDDEIVLDIPALGLHICEDSKYAGQLTLAQVVDTYMLLSQNEELSQIEPLYCQLSHRVCLASQMAYLTSSAREGKTYSDIAADYLDTPEPEVDPSILEERDVGDVIAYHDATDSEEAVEITGQQDSKDDNNVNIEVDHPTVTDEEEEAGNVANSESIKEETTETADNEPLLENSDEIQDKSNTTKLFEQEPIQAQPTSTETATDSKSNASSRTLENTEQNDDLEDTAKFADDNDQDFEPVEEEYLEFSDDETPADTDDQKPSVSQSPLAQEDHSNYDAHHDLPTIVHTEASTSVGDDLDTNDFVFDAEIGDENPEDLTEPTSVAQPVTPSKASNGKRKVEEDDDFLIDISTPEPKRTRAS